MTDLPDQPDLKDNWATGDTLGADDFNELADRVNDVENDNVDDYELPVGGIPASDLAAAVQAQLALAVIAYQKPVGGIPSGDLSSAVQTLLSDAASAYQKPVGGIPSSDLSAAVQALLTLAGSAYQKPGTGIPSSDMASAVQTLLTSAGTAYQKPGGGIPATDLTSAAQALLNSKNGLLDFLAYLASNYYLCNSSGSTGTANNLGFGVLRATPWLVRKQVDIVALWGEITSAGTAGNTLRLGIYADDGYGRPGALAIDAGTINGASATVQETGAFAHTFAAGLFWAAGVVQGATTQPTVRTVTGAAMQAQDYSLGSSLPSGGAAIYGYQVAGVTAALPDPFGTPTSTASAPRIGFKTAA